MPCYPGAHFGIPLCAFSSRARSFVTPSEAMDSAPAGDHYAGVVNLNGARDVTAQSRHPCQPFDLQFPLDFPHFRGYHLAQTDRSVQTNEPGMSSSSALRQDPPVPADCEFDLNEMAKAYRVRAQRLNGEATEEHACLPHSRRLS